MKRLRRILDAAALWLAARVDYWDCDPADAWEDGDG